MPGETDTRKMGFGINKLNELIEFSTVALPTDWATPVYLVIEDGPQPAPHPFPQPPR